MNFTDDPLGIKSVFVMFILLGIGMVLWDFIGFDSGIGGTPFNLFE